MSTPKSSAHPEPELAARAQGSPGGRRIPIAGSPWLPRVYIPRVGLWRRLDASTREAVTILVAPAGAGKTLGVAGWLQQATEREAVWLDANNPLTLSRLESTLDEAAANGSGEPRIVVIDDAHLLSGHCIRHIDQKLQREPATLRLLLLTRWDLAISGLVPELLGHLTVLRGDVLRLTDAEMGHLIRAHARTEATDVHNAIVERTRGWCAAVVLAARASAAASDPSEFARRCQESDSGIADLVAGEVFAALHPRERHLLLCTAMEGTLTAETARELTHDPRAGEVLSTLESTGLLVHRVSEGQPIDDTADDRESKFRLHPLIAEVARRRLAAGGVDAEQARATVKRAVGIQLGQGHLEAPFRRLLALGEYETAAEILAERGLQMVAVDDGRAIDMLSTRGGAAVDGHPATWATLACAKRSRGETEAALRWAERLVTYEASHPGVVTPVPLACMRLQRARSGVEPVATALEHARTVLDVARDMSERASFLPLLLLEMGVAENWLGDLAGAETHLSAAVLESRAAGLEFLATDAMSHLALTEFMAGREMAARDLATNVLSAPTLDHGSKSPVGERAEVVRALVRLQSLPWREPADVLPPRRSVVDDLAGGFWQRILAARAAFAEGSVAEARSCLQRDPASLHLPEHLQMTYLAEQVRLSILTVDREQLREASSAFAHVGATGESAWVDAALADLRGELRPAAELYEIAVQSARVQQPSIRLASLVCAAQLQHCLGNLDRARDLLDDAVVAAASRRDATPFVGWTAHGTPVSRLLTEMQVTSSAWTDELTAACGDRADVTASLRPRIATAQELSTVADPVVAPSLSPREKEVLTELARGATYSDIAANLFLSENTVKTHVSSLYKKLTVGRRSDALAVARKLHLL